MKLRRLIILLSLLFSIIGPAQVQVKAQTIGKANDGTVLKQIIIFGRHSIRSSTVKPEIAAHFTVEPGGCGPARGQPQHRGTQTQGG
jgi:hypothetical protein